MKYLKIFFQILFSFFFSGGVYCTIELIYRQYTHFSMFILAGVIGIFLYFLNNIFTYEMDYLLQIIIGTVFATLGEGTVGTILQKLHNGINPVWDYSNMPLSFFNGQCCALFTFFWLLIIAPSIILLDIYDWKIFNGETPYYKIFGHTVLKFKEKNNHE